MTERPLLSVIVVLFNMRREAPRTLLSLTKRYQHRARDIPYEVIVVDNGSSDPIDEEVVAGFGPEFRYYYLANESASPAGAVNFAATKAAGRYMTICVDGARILSPGILYYTQLATRLHNSPVIATLAWHLGSKVQNRAVDEGYNQQVEDALLGKVDWQTDGYLLFEISTLASSSRDGWFLPFAESNCLTVSREMFDELGGFAERFSSPGGGLVNLDYLNRAMELPQASFIVLLGEGTFHQFHGGISTNVPLENHPWKIFNGEYETIRGKKYDTSRQDPLFLGRVPTPSLRFLQHSVETAIEQDFIAE